MNAGLQHPNTAADHPNKLLRENRILAQIHSSVVQLTKVPANQSQLRMKTETKITKLPKNFYI